VSETERASEQAGEVGASTGRAHQSNRKGEASACLKWTEWAKRLRWEGAACFIFPFFYF
jgi:hypothetical protein